MHFKINWASHIAIVGSKFTVFTLLSFVFENNFPSISPRPACIWRGDLTEGFLRYQFGGLIHGGDYFQNFTVYGQAGYAISPTWGPSPPCQQALNVNNFSTE